MLEAVCWVGLLDSRAGDIEADNEILYTVQAGVSQKNRNFLADFPEFLAEPEFRLTSASEPGPED